MLKRLLLAVLATLALSVGCIPAHGAEVTLLPVDSFMALEPTFAGGLTVADCGAETDPLGYRYLAVGSGPGVPATVQVYRRAGNLSLELFEAWEAYPNFTGGLSVTCAMQAFGQSPFGGGIKFPLVTVGPGAGGGPHVKSWLLYLPPPVGILDE